MPDSLPISLQTFNWFYIFFKESGLCRTQRFGQAFINRYVEGSDPEIFYEENEGKAREMIRNKYVKENYEQSEST